MRYDSGIVRYDNHTNQINHAKIPVQTEIVKNMKNIKEEILEVLCTPEKDLQTIIKSKDYSAVSTGIAKFLFNETKHNYKYANTVMNMVKIICDTEITNDSVLPIKILMGIK